MKIYLLILICLITCVLFAQQPPAQLPSLLEENSLAVPILHGDENPDALIRKNVFVKITSDKSAVFTGEPFLVTYKLFTAYDVDPRVKKQPSFTGCSVVELSAENEPAEVMLEGKKFHVYTIRKIQVTPLEEGILQLGQVYVDNIIQLLHDDGRGIENFSITLHNDPLNITVKPLPADGRPGNFSGIVGHFSISASVDSNTVPSGENAMLHLTIKGTGNIEGVRLPVIAWPDITEHFEGSDTQYLDQDAYPVYGFKQFDIPFIGHKAGRAVIAPVSFSYFDPVLQQFTIISTGNIPVTFTAAISKDEQLKRIVTEDITNRKYLWIVGAIAVTVIAVLLISSMKKKDEQKKTGVPISIITAVIKKEIPQPAQNNNAAMLLAIESLQNKNDTIQFFSEAKRILTAMISNTTGINAISEEQMIADMKTLDTCAVLALTCEKIFKTCNTHLYSPLADTFERDIVYHELSAVYKSLYENS